MILEMLGDRQRILADAIHTEGKGLDTLHDQETVHWSLARTHITQRHDACTNDIGRQTGLSEHHAVVRNVRFVKPVEALLVGSPVELIRINNDPTDDGPMAGHVFGQRVYDDVTAMFDGSAQVWCRNGVVDNDGHAVRVGNVRDLFKIHYVSCRVADGFAVDRFGFTVDQSGHCVQIFWIDKPGFDAKLGKGMGKEVVGSTIQGRHAEEVVTRLSNGHKGIGGCRLP